MMQCALYIVFLYRPLIYNRIFIAYLPQLNNLHFIHGLLCTHITDKKTGYSVKEFRFWLLNNPSSWVWPAKKRNTFNSARTHSIDKKVTEYEHSIHQIISEKMLSHSLFTKILSSTAVFNIDNGVSWAANQYILEWFLKSHDTEVVAYENHTHKC